MQGNTSLEARQSMRPSVFLWGDRRTAPFGSLGQRGSSAVELALTLPILLIMVTGICSIGLLLKQDIQLTDAVNTGAKYLAIERSQTLDPCALVYTTVAAAAPNLDPTQMQFQFELNSTWYPSSTSYYTGSATSCSSATTDSGAAGNLIQGDLVKVVVLYPCTLFIYGTSPATKCFINAQLSELEE